MRVAQAVETNGAKMLAWLHDTLEDTKLTTDDLICNGFDMHIVSQLLFLTRKPRQTYFDYIMDLCRNGTYDALTVKIADLNDNLKDLEEGSMKDKYRFALFMIEEVLNS